MTIVKVYYFNSKKQIQHFLCVGVQLTHAILLEADHLPPPVRGNCFGLGGPYA